jgi:hypothetical protein
LLHGEVGRLLAFENASGIDANLAVRIAEVSAIAYQPSDRGELTNRVDRGLRMAGRQRRELFRVPSVEVTSTNQDPTNGLL